MYLSTGKGISAGKVAIISVILILFLAIGIYLYIFSGDKAGSVVVTLYQKDTSGTELEGAIRLECHVISETPEDYSGHAKFWIDYQDGERTCEGYLDVSEGYGSRIIQFTEFVVGNGNYTITVSVEDRMGSVAYDIGNIVESTDNTIELTTWETGLLNIIMTDRNGLNLRFNISQAALHVSLSLLLYKAGESREFTQSDLALTIPNYGMKFSRFGQYLRGNYSFQFTLTNNLVKPGSSYHILYNNFTRMLDTPPVADAGEDQTYFLKWTEPNKLVTIDASGSTDDGLITKYNWTFADPIQQQTNGYEETPENAPDGAFDGIHTFRFGTSLYEITVFVSDDNQIEGVSSPQTSSALVNVTLSH